MSAVRSFFSVLLLLAAVVCALLSGGAQWLDDIVRAPGSAAKLVAPLASDPNVLNAVATELEQSAAERIPTVVAVVPQLQGVIESALTRAVDEALSGEGVEDAWIETIDRTRAAAVADLDAYRADPSETPTIWLDLSPFVELGRARLTAAADPRIQPYLEQIAWPGEASIALGRPDAQVTKLASDAIGFAQHWRWGLAAAAVLAGLGLIVGSRRGRWVAWMVAGLLGLGAVVAGRFALGTVDLARSGSTQAAVVGGLAEATIDSLREWTATWPWLLLGAVAVGLVALFLVRRPRHV